MFPFLNIREDIKFHFYKIQFLDLNNQINSETKLNLKTERNSNSVKYENIKFGVIKYSEDIESFFFLKY